VPNNRIWKDPCANYTQGFNFIWNEVAITITFESNWRKAKDILTRIAGEQSIIKSEHAAAGPLRLVWIGSRSTLRQITSFLPVFEAIGRRAPGTVLRIIADAALEARHITVENVPWSREAEAALLAECDIGLSPLPDTPFTRGKCAFKIVQYMAAGLPVITSPVGANAEYVREGETGLWAETHEQWLAAFDRLAGDAALRASMGRAGRAFAERHLARNVLAGRLCDAVNRCLAG
jgi:glycosyltransferase involved in cell wall biosynthesis